jgi:hypothetical protein
VEAQAALVGPDGARELHAHAPVDLDVARVVEPGHAEHNETFWLTYLAKHAQQLGALLEHGLQRGGHLNDRVEELLLVGVAAAHALQHGLRAGASVRDVGVRMWARECRERVCRASRRRRAGHEPGRHIWFHSVPRSSHPSSCHERRKTAETCFGKQTHLEAFVGDAVQPAGPVLRAGWQVREVKNGQGARQITHTWFSVITAVSAMAGIGAVDMGGRERAARVHVRDAVDGISRTAQGAGGQLVGQPSARPQHSTCHHSHTLVLPE